MYTLGINSVFHDSSACLIKDGELIAAVEEERFTHVKHGKRPVPFSTYELPYHAINYCLETAGIHLKDVDYIAYSFNPDLIIDSTKKNKDVLFNDGVPSSIKAVYGKWDGLFYTFLKAAPSLLVNGYPHHLQKNFSGANAESFKWHYVDHHIAHAASAFHASPFTEAAVLTIDGRGEEATTAYFVGKNNSLEKIDEVKMPHSLGLLYETITSYLGFLHSSDEYKVMALASYGKPAYIDEFRSMINVKSNGQYSIDDYKLEERFGEPRKRNAPLLQRHYDIAHSLQKALEESVLKILFWLHEKTGLDNLCMAGGVALNCVMNAELEIKVHLKIYGFNQRQEMQAHCIGCCIMD